MLNFNRASLFSAMCIIDLFLTSPLSAGAAPDVSDKATESQSNNTSASKPHSSPLLRSSAQDTEKMEQSIKLFIPPQPVAPAAAPPRHFQAGTQQSSYGNQLNSQAASNFRPPQRDFRLDAHNVQPFMIPRQTYVPFLPMQRTFSQPAAPGGIWSSNGAYASQRVTQQQHGMPRLVSPRMAVTPNLQQTMTIQVDPWTNVTPGEPKKATELATLQTAIKRMHSGNAGTPMVATARQMVATQIVLPSLAAPLNWDDWYKRVATGIYNRWKQNTAGPGSAIVLITVYNSRDVDCRVTEFNPAAGAERDATSESRFKQVALQCVSTLSKDPMWQFPQIAPVPRKIVFDMDFRHAVGESAGCTVVHLHTNQPLDVDEAKK